MKKNDSRVYVGSAKIEKIEGKKFKRDIYNISEKVVGNTFPKQTTRKTPSGGGCGSCRGKRKV